MGLYELKHARRGVEPGVEDIGAYDAGGAFQMLQIEADRLKEGATVESTGAQFEFPASRAARVTSTRVSRNSPAAKKTTCDRRPS